MIKKWIIATVFLIHGTVCALSQAYQERIENLVKNNPSQLSVAEYSCIAEQLQSKAPCNFLIFGLGNDSQLWIDLNKGGKTVFIEDNSAWFAQKQEDIPGLVAYLVNYNTTLSQWKELLNQRSKLKMNLPEEIMNTKWDVIFVDAPAGYGNNAGRMKSIYMSSRLTGKHTDVFVHDCNRVVENTYATKFLKKKNLVKSIDRLQYYSIKSKP